MNYYYLDERDQTRPSWVLFDLVKRGRKNVRQSELPPAIYQFFGSQPEGEMRMKPEYLQTCCKKCGRYDEDAVFQVGFSDPVTIRIKGDYSHTQDRVFLVSERFLKVLCNAKVRGYESKPVGKSGWHALCVTVRVNCADGVLKPAEPYCPACGRPDGAVGSFERVSQLSVPRDDKTFITTNVNYHRRLWDRDIFITENVLRALKDGGIKGGYCSRLWTDEEVRFAGEMAKQGRKWKPTNSTVLL
mgnify:CR=1 FL=1